MKFLFTICVFLNVAVANSQSQTKFVQNEQVKDYIGKKELCIVLAPIDNDYVSKLKGKEKLDLLSKYETSVNTLNEKARLMFTKEWKLHDSVVFYNFDEIMDMPISERDEKAFVLMYPEESAVQIVSDPTYGSVVDGLDFQNIVYREFKAGEEKQKEKLIKQYKAVFHKPEKEKRDYYTFKFTSHCYKTLKNGKQKECPFNFVFSKCIDNLEATESKLKVLIGSTQAYFNFALEQESYAKITDYVSNNSEELKSKTLYVLNDQAKEDITIEEFRLNYPFKVEFVEQMEYDNLILKNDPNAAILSIEPMEQMYKYGIPSDFNAVFGHYIYSTKDFRMLGGQIPVVTPYKYSANIKITAKRVEKYTKW